MLKSEFSFIYSLPVVPQGGNTGLVGGSVPVFDETIISMSLMNQIISFDSLSGVLVCEAGCILEQLDDHVRKSNHIMPIDLGAKGSCHIGGNIATNAGGLRLLRYGSLHGSVLGLEVVLADGTTINNLNRLRKDNTGYDLKQLFIGSEGTLGIITKVAILTFPLPSSQQVSIIGLKSFEEIKEIFCLAKSKLGEILSAFEFWDSSSMAMVKDHFPSLKCPIKQSCKYFVLIETQGSDSDHDQQKLESFMESCIDKGLITDGSIAQDQMQMKEMWKFRESIPESCSKQGAVYKYDISLPISNLYDIVPIMRERLKGRNVQVIGYGHVGDGNLHLNISAESYNHQLESMIEPFIFEFVQSHGGSISAEHGIGQMKRNYLKYSKSDEMISKMKEIKRLFDPKGIMNPYKVLQ